MIIFCAGFFVFGFGAKASAATYYVRADGTVTAANKSNATSCSAIGTALNMAQVNLATFSGDDTVDGCGNTYTTALIPINSGTSGHPIIYQNFTIGSAVSIAVNLTAVNYLTLNNFATINNSFFSYYIHGSSYITINNSSQATAGTLQADNSSTHLTISNFTSTIAASSYGAALVFNSPGTDLNLSTVTVSGVNKGGILSNWTSNVAMSDIQSTGNTLNGVQVNGVTSGYLNLTNIYSGIQRDKVTAGANGNYGIYISGCNGALMTADGIYVSNNTTYGFLVLNSALASGSVIRNFSASHNGGDGIGVTGSPNLTIQHGTTSYNNNNGFLATGSGTTNLITEYVLATHNLDDGMDSTSGVPNWTVRYCESSYNGTTGAAASGDGFSTHDTCSTNFYYNFSHDNKNTGMAHIGTSTGIIYNNVLWSNGSSGDATMQVRAGLFLTSTANSAWTVENNIIGQNYPCEFEENGTEYNTLDHNLYYPLNNNQFYTAVANGTGYVSWTDYHSTKESHSLVADPLFISSSNFHLQNISPAINAGTNSVWSGQNNITDYESNPITNGSGTVVASGGTVDIGAYEFQDSTAPTTSADIVSGTYNTHQTVTLTYDDGSGVGCDKTYYTLTGIDPTTSSTQYTVPISIPDNATTVLKFFSTDRNVNSETIKSKTYTVDTVAPDTLIDTNPNSNTASTSATFTFHATETSTFQCKLDSGSYASCTSSKNYTALAEGAHTFSVKATDTANNEDQTPASYTWTVDITSPTISFSENVETGPVPSDTITADWGDATVKKWDYNSSTTCSTNSNDYSKTDADAMDQATETNNTKYLCLYAEDALGNKATLASSNPINISLPVVTTASKGDNDNHKSHHKPKPKPKPKTFQQKFTQKITATKKWFKKQNTTINRNLSLGSRGQDVGTLQTALQKLGLLQIKDTTYGVYKTLTQDAVTRLQQLRNIFPTGNFGSLTRNLFGW